MKKGVLLIFIFILALHITNAQIMPDWTWAKAISGPQGVQAQTLQMDNSGNIFISGRAFKGPLTIGGSIFSSDTVPSVFISKFSSAGSVLWTSSVTINDSVNSGSVYLESLMLDSYDNIFLTVGLNGMGMGQGKIDTIHLIFKGNQQVEFTLMGSGYMELPIYAIIKLDSEGNLLYITPLEGFSPSYMGKGATDKTKDNKKKGGGFNLSINDKKTDQNGNLYLAGSFSLDSFKLGNIMIRSFWANKKSFIAKIDSAGNYAWVTIDSASLETGIGGEAMSLVLDPSGNPVVLGDFGTDDRKFGNNVLTLAPNFGSKLYLLSLSKDDGSVNWAIKYDGTLADNADKIMFDNAGNLFISGYTNSSSLFGQNTLGTQNYSIFLTNIDLSGNVIWSKIINTELTYLSSSNILRVLFDSYNYPIVSGMFQASTLSLDEMQVHLHDTTLTPYTNDIFTAKINPENQSAVYLNSFGTYSYDYDFNSSIDKHNLLTFVIPATDSLVFISNDTLKFTRPVSGLVIAHIDSAGNMLAKSSFVSYPGQSMYLSTLNVVQSYSGYLGVMGTFYGPTYYLGSNTLNSPDSSYFSVFVSKMGYKMSGNIYDQSLQKITDGYVKLYVLEKTGPATLVDSSWVNMEGNSYYFNDAPLNGGLLYAVPDTNVYHNYVATYAGNSMLWTGATVLDLISTPPSTFDVTLQQVLPVSGPGSIAGIVSETISDTTGKIKKLTGRPMKGASVVLVGKSTKGSDSIIAITFTDAAGFYQFVKIPVGNYNVWIDVAGLGMKEYYSIGITEASPEVANIDYVVAETGIYKDLSSAIKTTKQLNDAFSVYPNPAVDFIRVTVAVKGLSNARLDIYSVNGSFISSYILESVSNGSAYINVAQLKPGMYILKAQFAGKTPLYARFIKG